MAASTLVPIAELVASTGPGAATAQSGAPATVAISVTPLSTAVSTSNINTTPSTTTTTCLSNTTLNPISEKDFELLSREVSDLKSRLRKLQSENEEKNEIILILKDELEATKEQNVKFDKDNRQLLLDLKKFQTLQDEFDDLKGKEAETDKLNLEITRLKEKLAELDFLKLRIGELEDDRKQATDECGLFAERCKQAEAKLGRVADLEQEVEKWRSFGLELESERDSLQSKLLDSIDKETKSNLINKQSEEEVKRLKSLVKFYEERRDEEEASNSLIMSAVDLKQANTSPSSSPSAKFTSQAIASQQQQQQQHQSSLLLDCSDINVENSNSIKYELDKQFEKELNEENASLKHQLLEKESKFNELISAKETIAKDLEFNRKLVADLRQDLACEKSIAMKLTNRLAGFTKQIKTIDKNYFPMHDHTSLGIKSDATSSPAIVNVDTAAITDRVIMNINNNNIDDDNTVCYGKSSESFATPAQDVGAIKESAEIESSLSKRVKLSSFKPAPYDGKLEHDTTAENVSTFRNATTASQDRQATKCISSDATKNSKTSQQESNEKAATISTSVHDSGFQSINQDFDQISPPIRAPVAAPPNQEVSSRQRVENQRDNQQQQQPADAGHSPNRSKPIPNGRRSNTCSPSNETGRQIVAATGAARGLSSQTPTRLQPARLDSCEDVDAEEDDDDDEDDELELDDVKRAPTPVKTRSASSNFVRNSMSSRSVNYGHSSRSPYFDRFRASLKTNQTTISSTNSIEQQFSSQQQQLPVAQGQHDLCFGADQSSSRQLNALIDPVSSYPMHPLLVQGMQQGQQANYLHPTGGQHQQHGRELNEQQLAHLNSLHRQHYYHHLQQMHQLHRLHHHHQLHLQHQMHHHHHHQHHQMHHRYPQAEPQQQQNQQQALHQAGTSEQVASVDKLRRASEDVPKPVEPIYSGGSQFHAPSAARLNQIYANTPQPGSGAPVPSPPELVEKQQQQQKQFHSNSQATAPPPKASQSAQYCSMKPSTGSQVAKLHQPYSYYALPQIAEVNGLPCVSESRVSLAGARQTSVSGSPPNRLQAVNLRTSPEGSPQSKPTATTMTPTSASVSPTSSTSSTSSVSSSCSSSSSMSSLSAPGFALNRSNLRHSTSAATCGAKRQFSVERELVGGSPRTATLSRVGSCRATQTRSEERECRQGSARPSLINQSDANKLRAPLKSQLPPMRTSKILNIGGQQQAQAPNGLSGQNLSTSPDCQQRRSINQNNLVNRRLSTEQDALEKLANNLTTIRLNDQLAFSSLRKPKGLASAVLASGQATSAPKRVASVTPEKATSGAASGASGATSGNKSSVWFEYGCV